APSTDPGWTPLFLLAAGLVMETGGYLSHGAIVAREYGIPAVLNVPLATQRIPDGSTIVLDGAQGGGQLLAPTPPMPSATAAARGPYDRAVSMVYNATKVYTYDNYREHTHLGTGGGNVWISAYFWTLSGVKERLQRKRSMNPFSSWTWLNQPGWIQCGWERCISTPIAPSS